MAYDVNFGGFFITIIYILFFADTEQKDIFARCAFVFQTGFLVCIFLNFADRGSSILSESVDMLKRSVSMPSRTSVYISDPRGGEGRRGRQGPSAVTVYSATRG